MKPLFRSMIHILDYFLNTSYLIIITVYCKINLAKILTDNLQKYQEAI